MYSSKTISTLKISGSISEVVYFAFKYINNSVIAPIAMQTQVKLNVGGTKLTQHYMESLVILLALGLLWFCLILFQHAISTNLSLKLLCIDYVSSL